MYRSAGTALLIVAMVAMVIIAVGHHCDVSNSRCWHPRLIFTGNVVSTRGVFLTVARGSGKCRWTLVKGPPITVGKVSSLGSGAMRRDG